MKLPLTLPLTIVQNTYNTQMQTYNQDEVMNEIGAIRTMTSFPRFVQNITNQINGGLVNYHEFAILYATLNKNRELIQMNYSRMSKTINTIILRKQEFINTLQESNICPQWLKEIGVQQIETFTDFAEKIQEHPMEI
jgi:hypothetical protein